MSVREALADALSAPSAGDLWKLRAEMLQAGVPAGAKVWRVVDEFRHFLDELATSTSSKDYSRLASRLDIGAVSGVVVEHMVETEDSGDLGMRLLTAILSEGLMILATLHAVESADFLFVERQTGLTRGNISSHMGKLEAAGYIEINKGWKY